MPDSFFSIGIVFFFAFFTFTVCCWWWCCCRSLFLCTRIMYVNNRNKRCICMCVCARALKETEAEHCQCSTETNLNSVYCHIVAFATAVAAGCYWFSYTNTARVISTVQRQNQIENYVKFYVYFLHWIWARYVCVCDFWARNQNSPSLSFFN